MDIPTASLQPETISIRFLHRKSWDTNISCFTPEANTAVLMVKRLPVKAATTSVFRDNPNRPDAARRTSPRAAQASGRWDSRPGSRAATCLLKATAVTAVPAVLGVQWCRRRGGETHGSRRGLPGGAAADGRMTVGSVASGFVKHIDERTQRGQLTRKPLLEKSTRWTQHDHLGTCLHPSREPSLFVDLTAPT